MLTSPPRPAEAACSHKTKAVTTPEGDGILPQTLLSHVTIQSQTPSNTSAILITFPLGWKVALLISESELNLQSTGHSPYFSVKLKSFPLTS